MTIHTVGNIWKGDDMKEQPLSLNRSNNEDYAKLKIEANLEHETTEAEIAKLKAENEKLGNEAEQLRVQLAGCGVAALGYTGTLYNKNDCKKGDYGWSASFKDVKDLWTKHQALKAERDKHQEAAAHYEMELFTVKKKFTALLDKITVDRIKNQLALQDDLKSGEEYIDFMERLAQAIVKPLLGKHKEGCTCRECMENKYGEIF